MAFAATSRQEPVITRVAIIGAGLKGACVAALLREDAAIELVLLEASSRPMGGTFANHGRLHAGSAGWNRDDIALMKRRYRGSTLFRTLGIGQPEGKAPAIYNFTSSDKAAAFTEKISEAGIPCRRGAPDAIGSWFREPGTMFELPEYAFNPARLSMRLLSDMPVGAVRWSTPVEAVSTDGDMFRLRLGDSRLKSDVVINCAARWSQDLALDWRQSALLDLEDHQWSVLVAASEGLPPLNRVLVDHALGDNASVVPHGKWVTFDYKSPSRKIEHNRGFTPTTLTRVDATNPLFVVCADAFSPIGRITDVFAFTGVQARQVGARPGSVNEIHRDPDHPGYLIAQGGQASTAMIDALDVAQALWISGVINREPLALLHDCILRAGVDRPEAHAAASMAWEIP